MNHPINIFLTWSSKVSVALLQPYKTKETVGLVSMWSYPELGARAASASRLPILPSLGKLEAIPFWLSDVSRAYRGGWIHRVLWGHVAFRRVVPGFLNTSP